MKKLLLLFLLAGLLPTVAQTVSVQASAGNQVATSSVPVTRRPKLTVALTCPQAALDPGASMTCTVTVNIAATVVPMSSDTTQITVPSTVTFAAGSLSAPVVVTAVP